MVRFQPFIYSMARSAFHGGEGWGWIVCLGGDKGVGWGREGHGTKVACLTFTRTLPHAALPQSRYDIETLPATAVKLCIGKTTARSGILTIWHFTDMNSGEENQGCQCDNCFHSCDETPPQQYDCYFSGRPCLLFPSLKPSNSLLLKWLFTLCAVSFFASLEKRQSCEFHISFILDSALLGETFFVEFFCINFTV